MSAAEALPPVSPWRDTSKLNRIPTRADLAAAPPPNEAGRAVHDANVATLVTQAAWAVKPFTPDELRDDRLDERLVYRKSLRKAPEAYTATTPPHVAAARKIAGQTRGRVAYVITTRGPEPALDRASPIDYEHYVERQLRAVAEPVLTLLGQDFDDVSGARKQLTLF